jgi:hypothetical protein
VKVNEVGTKILNDLWKECVVDGCKKFGITQQNYSGIDFQTPDVGRLNFYGKVDWDCFVNYYKNYEHYQLKFSFKIKLVEDEPCLELKGMRSCPK